MFRRRQYLINAVGNVSWITKNLLATGHFATGTNTDNLAIFEHDFINRLIQHVGAAVDSAQAGKALRQLSQAVQWI